MILNSISQRYSKSLIPFLQNFWQNKNVTSDPLTNPFPSQDRKKASLSRMLDRWIYFKLFKDLIAKRFQALQDLAGFIER